MNDYKGLMEHLKIINRENIKRDRLWNRVGRKWIYIEDDKKWRKLRNGLIEREWKMDRQRKWGLFDRLDSWEKKKSNEVWSNFGNDFEKFKELYLDLDEKIKIKEKKVIKGFRKRMRRILDSKRKVG